MKITIRGVLIYELFLLVLIEKKKNVFHVDRGISTPELEVSGIIYAENEEECRRRIENLTVGKKQGKLSLSPLLLIINVITVASRGGWQPRGCTVWRYINRAFPFAGWKFIPRPALETK